MVVTIGLKRKCVFISMKIRNFASFRFCKNRPNVFIFAKIFAKILPAKIVYTKFLPRLSRKSIKIWCLHFIIACTLYILHYTHLHQRIPIYSLTLLSVQFQVKALFRPHKYFSPLGGASVDGTSQRLLKRSVGNVVFVLTV